jgi:transposase
MEVQGDTILIPKQTYEELLRNNEVLLKTIESLRERVQQLEDTNKALQERLNKDSLNSDKPPSSDGYRKGIKNNREKSGKRPGAQKGHQGRTLNMVSYPEKVIEHKVKGQCPCGKALEQALILRTERRQVFDLPEQLMEVTEHQVEIRQCSCGVIHQAACQAKGNAQYGSRIKSLGAYLNQYQFMPFERLQEFFEDVIGTRISDGVLTGSNDLLYKQLETVEEQIKQALQESKVLHNDETGMRCNGKLQWIHSSSTPHHTHYSIHPKRGKEAMDVIGILPDFRGVSVHDRWAPYDKYACTHALCNAHLLRELKSVKEESGREWAARMITLLTCANDLKKENKLDATAIGSIEKQYKSIIQQGIKEEPPLVIPVIKKRGRIKKPKPLKLLEAFINRKEQILRFVYNKAVPFDNNLAERDIRMVKLKQKISGCFRTSHGAEVFCRIRSYISTVRKQGHSVLNAIEKALVGNPIEVDQPC